MNERNVFLQALEIEDKAALEAFLEKECAGQPELRDKIEKLLEAHVKAGSFLNVPHPVAAAVEQTGAYESQSSTTEKAGMLVAGKYKLLQQIGEGGMGSVWMADQTEPVKRRVAVKLIRTERGSSKTILARFEAERQAIALMDHPHIARLLDAGTTENSSPFFVMELVKGVPLTEFCDSNRLSIQERLNLFMQICAAVQHAHQKGIIHRDLKPSNILVEQHDDKPVPKVIDFGLAKATSGMQLTENTLFTGFGTVAGTPLYMAPEQAKFNAVDIDTRADIYALGVILYELLTGTTPISRETIKKAALDEMMKLIREQEAPTPSSRLSATESKPTVAANRHMEPEKLGRFLKGELDWIVMKALSKERERRYETASGFAKDVERFLNHEAVQAGPVSASYRLKKFVKRNKGKVVAAGVVTLALLGGIAGTSVGLYQANLARDAEAQERGKAEAAAERERLAKLAEEAKRKEAETNLAYARKGNEILGSVFAGLNPKANYATVAELRDALKANLQKAVKELEGSAIGDPLVVATMQNTLGESLLGLGESEQAITLFVRARETWSTELGADHPTTLSSMNNLAGGYQVAGKLYQALPLFEETLKLTKAKVGTDHPDTLTSMNNLASVYQAAGKLDQALPLYEETFKLRKAKLGTDHVDTLTSMNNLAHGYHAAGKLDLALPLLEETFKLRKAKLGADHPHTLASMNNLAMGYKDAGKLALALPLLEETFLLMKAKLAADHPDTLASMNNLALGYQAAGKLALALPLFEETFKLRKAKLGTDHPDTLRSMNNLAAGYWLLKQLDKSVPLFEALLPIQEKKLERQHPQTQMTVANLGVNYKDAGRLAEALPLLEEAYRSSRRISTLRWVGAQLLNGYVRAGQRVEAVKLNDELLTDARQTLPKESPELASTLAQNGLALLDLRAFAEAELLLRECLAIREKKEPDNWRTFNTQSLLGGALLGQKKYGEAESLLFKGYEGMKAREKTIPPQGSTRIAEAIDRLVQLYTETNKPDEVKKWQGEKTRRQLNGLQQSSPEPVKPHDDEITEQFKALYQEHKNAEAVRLVEKAVADRSKLYGTDHPLTLKVMHCLGKGRLANGEVISAIQQLEKVHKSMQRVLGTEHLDTLLVATDLATAHHADGKLEQAISLLEASLKTLQARFGKDHPTARLAMLSLGEVYTDANKTAAALAILEELHGMGMRIFPAPDHLPVLEALGRVHLKAGKRQTAEQLIQECLERRMKQSPDAWQRYLLESHLGIINLEQKKYTLAETQLLSGYHGMKERVAMIPPQCRARMAETVSQLIQFYTETNKPEEVKKWQAEKTKLVSLKEKKN